MKLAEALRIVNENAVAADGDSSRVFLVCGFTPLHVETFLTAHLLRQRPDTGVTLGVGVYGDLLGNLARAAEEPVDAVAVVLEWSDLDPRLGIRQGGSWSPEGLSDVIESVTVKAQLIKEAVERLVDRSRVVVSLPTLPLPPADYTPGCESGSFDLALQRACLDLAAWCHDQAGATVLSAQSIDERSPVSGRFDIVSELRTGFPYTRTHAEVLGRQLAASLFPAAPKKGLITDLDDTLWRGILGEDGLSGIAWDLDAGAQVHALYQRLLAALAESGVLVGVASKNSPELVEEALALPGLLVSADQLFPVEANWERKSTSVARILTRWNVSADAVVFVDDSEIELAEVEREHPGITCLRFPHEAPAACWDLLHRIRDLFGKAEVTEEDRIRSHSLRSAGVLADVGDGGPDALARFLGDAKATIHVDAKVAADDARPLQLVNKTNQFNLNGIRLLESDWLRHLRATDAFAASFSYEDKYGPLGKIAVVAGSEGDGALTIDTWVMSCRAFGRHIEYQCLAWLFGRYDVPHIVLRYQPTARNRPLREFLEHITTLDEASEVVVTRERFEAHCPKLHHAVRETETSIE